MTRSSKSIEVLGIKPVADAALIVVKGSVDAAGAFLSRICLPAAEEFGLLLRDRVGAWRASNALAITEKAERRTREKQIPADHHAHPRLVGQILENGSWADSDEVQDLWAGLLASSCDASGTDDSNLMFIDLLTRLTISQVRMLNYIVQNSEKSITNGGWLDATYFRVQSSVLLEIAQVTDPHQIDRELDHLRSLGLLSGDSGFDVSSTAASIMPSTLALQMYARCHGHPGDPSEFFGLARNAT